ncbi:MAG: dockerin type I repeat-containing protein, partial [Ruminococcus sp.]
ATSNTSGYIFDFMVFKLKEEEIPSSSYTQITSADEFSEGGSYVLVAANEGNYYALGNTIGAKIDSVVVSVADNTVTAESLPVWQITATQNGVSLSNGTDFLSYGSTTDFKSSTESYEWNISQIATDGSFRFTASGSTSRAIAYSVSQNKFGAYATSNTSGYIFDFMVFKLKNSDTDTDTPGTTDPGNTEDEDLEDVLIGDVDQNGIINVRDVTKLQEYLVQEVVLTEQQKLCSDVNADNEINTRDVTLIQRYCVGLGYL